MVERACVIGARQNANKANPASREVIVKMVAQGENEAIEQLGN
jgi:hypothetical protein